MLIDCIGIVLFGIRFIVFIERKRSHSERVRERTPNEQKKKTHMCATASVLMSIILWWMCGVGRIWWSYWCWVWGASTFFHTNRCSCPNIVGKSASWMPHNRHPINHCLIINEKRFFLFKCVVAKCVSAFNQSGRVLHTNQFTVTVFNWTLVRILMRSILFLWTLSRYFYQRYKYNSSKI